MHFALAARCGQGPSAVRDKQRIASPDFNPPSHTPPPTRIWTEFGWCGYLAAYKSSQSSLLRESFPPEKHHRLFKFDREELLL